MLLELSLVATSCDNATVFTFVIVVIKNTLTLLASSNAVSDRHESQE